MDTARRARLARRRVVASLAAVCVAAALLVAVLVGTALRASLPLLTGERRVAGLGASVRIERDGLGIPTITAADRVDASFALGFLHAQDRFFQMDVLRRSAAGELAALFGRAALGVDRAVRVHRFRARARQLAATMPGTAHLIAYARGVNAGLTSLGGRPFEYVLLRARPEPWLPEDVVLCVFAMYLDLQSSDGDYESTVGVVHDVLPTALAEFLDARGTPWDAPLWGEAVQVPPIPGPDVVDVRRELRVGWGEPDAGARSLRLGQGELRSGRRELHAAGEGLFAAASDARAEMPDLERRGSNNWAVDGAHSADGGALLAGDMHLGLMVPNIWYRAAIVFPDAGATRRVTGITLPGTPAIVAGSNGDLAWAYTNSEIDTSDLVVVETDDPSKSTYRTPAGPRAFAEVREVIRVRGAPDDTLVVRETIWGPVVDRDHRGRERAFRWVAHDATAVDLGLLDMECARSVDEGVAVAKRTSIPAQNCVLADRLGRIAWTLMGPVPRRFGFDGRQPRSWADGTCGWDGVLVPAQVPHLVDPASGRIWTANNRVVAGDMLARVGDGGYALGARARQIRDALLALERATPAVLLQLQLDDRALFLAPWRDLMLHVLEGRLAAGSGAGTQGRDGAADAPAASSPDRRLHAALGHHVEAWGGRASISSVGYRAVRDFRSSVAALVFTPLLAPCRQADARVREWQLRQREGPLWRLLQERPPHLLDGRYVSWEAMLAAAVDSTLAHLQRSGADLSQRTWGEVNTTRIRHPLSRALPALSRWLDMPPRPLPGDQNMPRVQAPAAGASQRLVVSPGREAQGFFHMPCGQSGHPLSPYYRNAHRAWEEGVPTPFLPGPAQHLLRLVPQADVK